MSLEVTRSKKMIESMRKAYTINEWLEAVGGLVNAVEKLLMPFIVFFSFRMFWI
jgi:hypothetical protein